MDAAGTGGTALQADGGAQRPLPLIAAGAAATGGAESVGGGGAFAVADGLLESPACRLLPPWAKCPPLSLFADPSCLSTPAALYFSCKLGAVPTEMVQGKSQHPRQHNSAITTAGDHDISCHNHNKNIPCGL